MQFRKDINGLRAIAVIAVVIFHFFPNTIPGGFAGVDVFFVISGFLMTGIIFRGIEADNFSLHRFYIARANRIIPTLAVLCGAMLIFGWFYLSPVDYYSLAYHSLASITFVSNIIYCFGGGYFGENAHNLWLLHTWSLAVEWQFYILYPLILVGLKQLFTLKHLKFLIIISAFISFLISVGFTQDYKDPAFFLLPTRAWEMLAGGIAYLFPLQLNKTKGKILEIFGVGLILLTYFLANEHLVWPGYYALIPVLGAYCIILAAQNNSLLTSNWLFQKLGSWSYSIYLWHWPIAVFIYYNSLPMVYSIGGVIASVGLGFLSYTFIERLQFKNNYKSFTSYLTCYPVIAMGVICAVSSYVYLNNGLYTRYAPAQALVYQQALEALDDWHYPDANLTIDGLKIRFIQGETNENILFIGASHIMQTYPYIEEQSKKYNIYYLTKNGCLATPSFKNPKWSCDNLQNYKKLFQQVTFKKVITTAYSFDSYLPDDVELKDTEIKRRITEIDGLLTYFKQNAADVYLLLPEPKGQSFDPLLATRFDLPLQLDVQAVRAQFKIHEHIISQLTTLDRVKIIDPISFLCSEFCDVRDDQGFYYRDDNHMRPWYARQALQYLHVIIDL